MFNFFVIASVSAYIVCGQEGEVAIPEDKGQCVNQMVQWCDGMKYPQEGVGIAMMQISYQDQTGYYRIFCSTDSDGTNCTRNNALWFSCTSDNKFYYKGQLLTAGSTDVDDDICKTAYKAFNDIGVQSFSYDNKTIKQELEKGMETFFAQIAAMQEQIEALQDRMRRIPLFNGDLWNLWPTGSSPDETNSTTTEKEGSRKTNEIERENL